MVQPSSISMLTTLANLRRLEAQVNLSVTRADASGLDSDSAMRSQEARSIAIEASRRLHEVAALLQSSLDTYA